jgi:hypothetical protein
MPKEGEIVTAKNYSGQAFKIIDLQGEFAMIQRFNVSRRTLGDLILTVPIADIAPYREDGQPSRCAGCERSY